MADRYRVTSKRGDIGSLGFSTTTRIKDTKTGRTGQVCHRSGTAQYEKRQVGQAIQKGKVRWDS
jgi:hypothetical protein